MDFKFWLGIFIIVLLLVFAFAPGKRTPMAPIDSSEVNTQAKQAVSNVKKRFTSSGTCVTCKRTDCKYKNTTNCPVFIQQNEEAHRRYDAEAVEHWNSVLYKMFPNSSGR